MARRLAEALVTGPWRPDDLAERSRSALGRRPRWLPSLLKRVIAKFDTPVRPTSGRLVDFLLLDPGFRRGCAHLPDLAGPQRLEPQAVMWPSPGVPSSWSVPGLTTPSELADHLKIGLAELEWLADSQGRERRSPADAPRRYLYRWVAKRSGGARLVEVPGPRLMAVQRRVLEDIVTPIPPHDAAHGFRTGRSVRTFVAPHVGRRVVLKMDLTDFFPTISSSRITALFLTAGYPEPVARLLSGLATNSAPSSVWDDRSAPSKTADTWRSRRLHQRPHLPQGAPTSPALANLCAYRLDLRLVKLAESAGATYTRYADDLAFSGDHTFERSVSRFHIQACAIALEEGFEVNTRKTRVMRQAVRQRVAGVVINEHPNVARGDFDTLKAILHNCVKHGTKGQNRRGIDDFRAHLLGRISYVGSLNPERGRKLRAVFDRIVW